MRQKNSLSPAVLKEFKTYCEHQDLQVNYIDEYMYILSGLIAFDETRDFPSRMARIAGKKQWNNPADRRMFSRRYMDFVTATELFIETIAKGEQSITGRLADELFVCFNKVHLNDPIHFSMITCNWGYRIAKIITDTYHILPGENIDEFTRNIIGVLGEAYGQIFPGFISLLGQNLKDPKEDMLSVIFRIITVMVSDMNSRRKAVIEARLVQKNDGEAGRNDPCPCGSGLKYKKCCMEKNERNQEGY